MYGVHTTYHVMHHIHMQSFSLVCILKPGRHAPQKGLFPEHSSLFTRSHAALAVVSHVPVTGIQRIQMYSKPFLHGMTRAQVEHPTRAQDAVECARDTSSLQCASETHRHFNVRE